VKLSRGRTADREPPCIRPGVRHVPGTCLTAAHKRGHRERRCPRARRLLVTMRPSPRRRHAFAVEALDGQTRLTLPLLALSPTTRSQAKQPARKRGHHRHPPRTKTTRPTAVRDNRLPRRSAMNQRRRPFRPTGDRDGAGHPIGSRRYKSLRSPPRTTTHDTRASACPRRRQAQPPYEPQPRAALRAPRSPASRPTPPAPAQARPRAACAPRCPAR